MQAVSRSFPSVTLTGKPRSRRRSQSLIGHETLIRLAVTVALAVAAVLLTLPPTFVRNLAHVLPHVLMLGAAALVFAQSDPGFFRVRKEFLVLGALWVVGIGTAAIVHSDSMLGLVNYVRHYVVVPAALIICGRYLSRQPPGWTGFMFALSGMVNLALMLWYVLSTGEITQTDEGEWVGGDSRVYMDQLDGSRIIGPAAVANCAACFAGGLLLICPGALTLKILQLVLLAGGVYLGIATGTRTPLLALGIVVCILVVALFLRRLISMQKILVGAVVLTVFVSGIVALNRAAEFSRADRFALEVVTEKTLTGRTEIWSNRIARIAKNPFGLGYLNSVEDDGLSAHNNYLESFMSHGWLAGLAYTVAALWMGLLAGSLAFSTGGDTHRLACAALVGWCLVVGMVEAYSQAYPQVNALWWFAVGSFAVFAEKKRRHRHWREKAGRKAAASSPSRVAVLPARGMG